MRFFLSLTASMFIASSAFAFQVELPVDCSVGVDCYVQNFVDVDSTPGWKDFSCGRLTYNGHDGTDIRLKNFVAMEHGVAVLAAADGVVRGLRDGVEDVGMANPAAIKNKECGNGVMVDHADGWQTQYCHMKKGSIRVFKGQQVKTGDVLGQVGFSGQTAFPHLHITVRHDGKVLDPFTSQPIGSDACGEKLEAGMQSLWSAKSGVRYIPTAMLGAGFTTKVPDADGIRRGRFNESSMEKDAPFLIGWADMMGVQAGDVLQIRMIAPDGTVFFAKDETYANPKVAQFTYAGRKREGAVWLPGTYTGSVTLLRKGQQIGRLPLGIRVRE